MSCPSVPRQGPGVKRPEGIVLAPAACLAFVRLE
jgi:hypothetical protein